MKKIVNMGTHAQCRSRRLIFTLLLCMFSSIPVLSDTANRACPTCPITESAAKFCNVIVQRQACINGNTQVGGNLTVCGTVTEGNTQINGNLNVTGLINGSQLNVSSANYVFSYDPNTQTTQMSNVFQDIDFGVDAQINGWLHTAGTAQFTCAQTGLYLVEYDAVLRSFNNSDTLTTIRAALAANEIAGSSTTVNLPATGDAQEVSRSFIITVAQGQIVTFQLGSALSGVQLFSDPAGLSVVNPSITITITRIA